MEWPDRVTVMAVEPELHPVVELTFSFKIMLKASVVVEK